MNHLHSTVYPNRTFQTVVWWRFVGICDISILPWAHMFAEQTSGAFWRSTSFSLVSERSIGAHLKTCLTHAFTKSNSWAPALRAGAVRASKHCMSFTTWQTLAGCRTISSGIVFHVSYCTGCTEQMTGKEPGQQITSTGGSLNDGWDSFWKQSGFFCCRLSIFQQ